MNRFPFTELPFGQSPHCLDSERAMKLTSILHQHRDPGRDLLLPPNSGPVLVQGCGAHRKTLERSRA